MSLEILLPSFGDLGNFSLILLVAAVLLFYFGKLVGDTKVEKQNTADYYVHGLVFILLLLILPSLLVWIFVSTVKIYLPLVIGYIIQLVILALYSQALRVNVNRYRLFSKYDETFKKIFDIQKKKKSAINTAVNVVNKFGVTNNFAEQSLESTKQFANLLTNTWILFISAALVIWSFFSAHITESLMSPSFILISILCFVNFTVFALEYGYVNIYHPPTTIILENGKTVKGRLVKVSEFIQIVQEDTGKKIFVNSDKVICVEEDMLKENAVESLNK